MKIYIYSAFAVIAGLVIYHFYGLATKNQSLEFAAAQTKIVVDEKKADEVATNKIETKYQTITKVDIQYVDRIVIKKVIEYRDRVPGRCMLHPEWVRTYNLSTEQVRAESSASEPNGSSATLTKAVDDAVALEVSTSNNRSCVAIAAQLEALQEWAQSPLQDDRK